MNNCHVVTPVHIPQVLHYGRFQSIPCSSKNLPSVGGQCIFINVFMSLLSFHTTTSKLPLTLVFMSLCFSFFPKSYGMPFQFCLTVPQQFMVLLCKSTDKSREEKVPIYSSCATFMILEVGPVTVA